MTLRFDDKVVVITGAGNGLGYSHAMDFAARGARLVINDLGGTGSGAAADGSVAARVAQEIRALGGEAVANGDSVENGERIIEAAMDHFGRVDVLVNNAGILRDASFHKTSDEAWEGIYRVHLYGTYKTTRAAWEHMRRENYGRIVMTSSAAGIYGNFGQANYAAAKLGVVGLANTLAVEGASRGIFTNVIAPTAASRLTETVMGPEMLAALDPELVTPLVVALCHARSQANGAMYEVGGGWVARVRWQQARGVMFGREIRAEAVMDRWGDIENFDGALHPGSIGDTIATLSGHIGVSIGLSAR